MTDIEKNFDKLRFAYRHNNGLKMDFESLDEEC